MTEKSEGDRVSDARPEKFVGASVEQPQKTVSRSLVFIIVVFTAATSFVLGTRNQDILAVVGPAVGIRTAGSTLDLSSVQATYRELSANFDGTLDRTKLIEGANRGMVEAAGDPYTVYMNREEAQEFRDDLSGTIGGGIGAEIGIRSDRLTVIRALKGNPAEKAGIATGDVILAVNDESAADWTVDETVSKIRGEEGTTVKLLIERGGAKQEVTITRAIINNPSVTSSVENGIGILSISRFDNHTVNLAREAAEDFKEVNVKGVVLDLRGNGGGYLTAAQGVAGIWLNQKLIVVEKANGVVKDELKSGSNPILEGVPTTVLVNGGSASASEIVAGALKDNGAAKLVGEKTFGKGTVQLPIDLAGGSILKVTIARWYTPKGVNISEQGIKPDIAIELTQADINKDNDTQLQAAKNALVQ